RTHVAARPNTPKLLSQVVPSLADILSGAADF
ncbi:MAG: hypothetical protein ACI9PU_001105, partial [Ascidiaceihabitans sp.]